MIFLGGIDRRSSNLTGRVVSDLVDDNLIKANNIVDGDVGLFIGAFQPNSWERSACCPSLVMIPALVLT
jgi:hypothetical protein